MDIDYASGRIAYGSADKIIAFIREHGLKLEWLIETHVHADHLSGASYIQGKLGGTIGIGEKIGVVQETFAKVFNEGTEFRCDGSQFDHLFRDGERYLIGSMKAFAMHTPGHTQGSVTLLLSEGAAFVGDLLLASGAPILHMKVVRKPRSRTQGGRLAQQTRARGLALMISDVAGDDPSSIASGPCSPDPGTYADALAILARWRVAAPQRVRCVPGLFPLLPTH